MPELPEVETIKKQLLKKVKGKTIKEIKIKDYLKNFWGGKKNLLAGVINVQRRAKLLIFNLSNGYSFIIHLKLTGQLVYNPKEMPRFAKVIFTFSDGSRLIFNDFRKFGFVKVMKTSALKKYFAKFGPEPLEMSFKQFKQIIEKKSKAKIKPVLMDQSVIAGLGNIYAQEACFLAGILPIRIISSLTENEIKRLYQGIQKIMKEAIKYKGTSFDTIYVTVSGKPGGFDVRLKVYHQDKCLKCKSKLKIIKLGGRSTYYCSKCQT